MQMKMCCLDIHYYANINNNISNSFSTTECSELNYISNENCFEIYARNKLTVALLLANFSILSWRKRFLHRSLPSRKHRRSHRQFCKGCKNSKEKFFHYSFQKSQISQQHNVRLTKRMYFNRRWILQFIYIRTVEKYSAIYHLKYKLKILPRFSRILLHLASRTFFSAVVTQ